MFGTFSCATSLLGRGATDVWSRDELPLLQNIAEYGPYAFAALLAALVLLALVRHRRYRAVSVLTAADREAVRAALAAAERRTIGEIVPVVVERSDEHPGARWLWALVAASVGSVLLERHLAWDAPHWLILEQFALGEYTTALAAGSQLSAERRAAVIAAALSREGFAVELVSGGLPIRGLDIGKASLTQLPPLRATDSSFRTLVDEQDQAIDDAWKGKRRDALLEVFMRGRPDVLITELFPLGRRSLSFELVPLIEAARACANPPLIVASVRDVLARKADERKTDEMVTRASNWYDHILVHGDPALIGLDASFPAHRIAKLISYTGYVGADPTPAPPPGAGAGRSSRTLAAPAPRERRQDAQVLLRLEQRADQRQVFNR